VARVQPLEPPPITIRDPSRPAPCPDLFEKQDRDLRRPGRQTQRDRPTRRGRLLGALILAFVAVAGLDVEHRRAAATQAELDRVAREEVAVVLSAAVQGELHGVETDVPVVLRNEGPHRLTVVSVRLDQPGYAVQPVGTAMEPAQDTTVVIRIGPGCRTPVASVGPRRLLVLAQDTRGGRRELALATAPEMLDEQILLAARRACGLLPLQESLEPRAVQVRRVRDTVELNAPLQNVGVLPVVLVGVAPDRGLSVTVEPALPLPLRPDTGAGSSQPAQPLRFVLRVARCDALARRPLLGQQGRSLVLRLRGSDGGVATTSLLPGLDFDRLLNRLEQETCKLSPHGL